MSLEPASEAEGPELFAVEGGAGGPRERAPRSEPKASEVRAPAGPGRGRAIGTIGLLAAALVLVGFLALGQYQSAQKLEVRVQALTTELADARETLAAQRRRMDGVRTRVADISARLGQLQELVTEDP